MRLALLAFLVPSLAHADAKSIKGIESAVKGHIEGIAKLQTNPNMMDDAVIIMPSGSLASMPEEACLTGIANDFYGCLQASVDHKVGKIRAFADDTLGVGWFIAPFTATITGDNPETGEPAKPHVSQLRVGGIVLGGGAVWAIATGFYTEPVSDRELFKKLDAKLPTAAPKLTGDKDAAKAVAEWFKSGFLPAAHKTKSQLVASGTAPAEFGTGDQAIKFAKAWDKLKIAAVDIDAKFVKPGVWWVRATTVLPSKSGKDGHEMILAAIVLKNGDDYRWVSLQFGKPSSNI